MATNDNREPQVKIDETTLDPDQTVVRTSGVDPTKDTVARDLKAVDTAPQVRVDAYTTVPFKDHKVVDRDDVKDKLVAPNGPTEVHTAQTVPPQGDQTAPVKVIDPTPTSAGNQTVPATVASDSTKK